MTLLLVPIMANSPAAAQAAIARALREGADGVELRVDLLADLSDAQIIELCESVPPPATCLVTHRSRGQGGASDESATQRAARLQAIGPHANVVDCEWSDWRDNRDVRSRIVLAIRPAQDADRTGGNDTSRHAEMRRLLLSRHWLAGRPPTLSTEVAAMLEMPLCDVVKIAWTARTIRDCFEAFDLMRQSCKPMIALCMGEAGVWSRLVAGKAGAMAAFAALDDHGSTAPGQPTLAEMRSVYRIHKQSVATRLYGVIGDPITHSLSPAIHNAAFDQHGLDAVYCPLQVAPGYESFKAFMVEVLDRTWLDLRGLSITAPHKENALRFAESIGASCDDDARRAGAVNTLVLEESGTVRAFNTDVPAAIESLCAALNIAPTQLRGLPVTLLGAGGVARACAAGLSALGAKVMICARDARRAAEVAERFAAHCVPWEDRPGADPEVVINCTPVGSGPDVDATPLEARMIPARALVFDMLYRPDPTRLVRDAQQRGCRTRSGMDMFRRQAARQFELWTGRPM